MIRSALIGALLSMTAATAAPAKDPRLATRAFNADEVVRIDGRIGVQTSIAFADNEQIENVAIGDSSNWQITPNKRANLLFVKPLAARARTNMTVVTDRRTYVFDLAASPAARPVYMLRFTYADEPSGRTPPAPGTLTPEETQAILTPPVGQPADPASLNFAWRTRGKATLLPARIYDDGASTFLSWPVGAPIPAIQIRDASGTEGPVNFAVRGDVIVIDGVPDLIVLRSGRDFATLENNAPARAPGPAPTPTPIPTPAAPAGSE